MSNENLISRQIEEYIAYKQSLGFIISVESQELRRFAKFTREICFNGSLSSELAMRWSTLKSDYSRFYMSRRLETIHTFAKYIIAFDPNAQLPQLGVFGKAHIRVSPYIYSNEEISLLMAEARKLFSPDGIRAFTVPMAIGLMRATGVRVSELTLLKNEDVDLEKGYLFIRSSKFKKDRIVPLHQTVLNEMLEYRSFIIGKLGRRHDADCFFVSSYGHKFNTRAFEYAFQSRQPPLQVVV